MLLLKNKSAAFLAKIESIYPVTSLNSKNILLLANVNINKLSSFGLTYVNYHPNIILDLQYIIHIGIKNQFNQSINLIETKHFFCQS